MQKALICFMFSVFAIQASASFSYDLLLKPNHTETIKNYAPWTVSGTCKLESSDDLISLDVSIKGDGSINGSPVTSGDKINIKAHNNEEFRLTASAGAKLEITKVNAPNQSIPPQAAIAHCHV